MHSEHWQRVEQIYQLAVEQPVGARAAFLASACGGDKDLLREVEALLAQEDAATVGTTAWIPAKLTTGRLEAGGQVGPYKLEAPIGAGGMGEVFRAVDTRLRRSVAIKFLLGAGASNPVHRRRFLQEARAASALNHPNIVVIYDIASQDGVDFLEEPLAEQLFLPEISILASLCASSACSWRTKSVKPKPSRSCASSWKYIKRRGREGTRTLRQP